VPAVPAGPVEVLIPLPGPVSAAVNHETNADVPQSQESVPEPIPLVDELAAADAVDDDNVLPAQPAVPSLMNPVVADLDGIDIGDFIPSAEYSTAIIAATVTPRRSTSGSTPGVAPEPVLVDSVSPRDRLPGVRLESPAVQLLVQPIVAAVDLPEIAIDFHPESILEQITRMTIGDAEFQDHDDNSDDEAAVQVAEPCTPSVNMSTVYGGDEYVAMMNNPAHMVTMRPAV
jgi:hypothetical protein